MKRLFLIFSAILLSIPFGLLFVVPSASAASIYDNNYHTTSELIVESTYNSCEAVDVRDTYFNIFDDRDKWEDGNKYDTYIDLMRDSVSNGSVSISSYNQLQGVGLDSTYKTVLFTYINGDTTVNWNTDTVTLTKDNSSDTGVYIELMYKQDAIGNGGCEIFVRAYDFNSIGSFVISSNDSNTRSNYTKNFLTYGNVDFNYPAGYDGEQINETPPEPEKGFTPIVAWNYNGNKRIFATAHTEETLCIPFSNGGCYNNDNLLVKWELIDNDTDEILKEQTTQHWSEKFEYDDVILGNNYTLRAKYIAPTHIPEPPVANNVVFHWISFEINTTLGIQSGSQLIQECEFTNDTWTCTPPKEFKECFKSDFPYVDINECMYNMRRFIEILTFDKIALIPKVYENTEVCKEIQILGDWLYLDNKVLCPQVPKNIRDTVTPFVIFALAISFVYLIIAKANARKELQV